MGKNRNERSAWRTIIPYNVILYNMAGADYHFPAVCDDCDGGDNNTKTTYNNNNKNI